MATTSTNNSGDWKDVYTGFPSREVGAGTIDPGIYSNPNYAKKKTQKILIGGLTQMSYAGYEVDAQPLVITLGFEPAYNTIIALNLHYVPERIRHSMVQFIIKTNINRIRAQKPLIIDYKNLKKVFPQVPNIVRRYKVVLIRVQESYPLEGWGVAIKGSSKFDSVYKN